MKTYINKLLLSTVLLTTSLCAQNSIGLDINSDDVEILGSINLNRFVNYADSTAYILDINYLNTEKNDGLITVGVSGQNQLQGVAGLTLGFGLRGEIADDFLAFPLMAKANYRLPFNDTFPPTSLNTTFAYAPSVLSFNDAQSYSELRVEADMEVISNIHLFTGYRNIHTEYDQSDLIFNNGFYGGMKLSF
jgi:hypothetical protein